MPLKAIDSSTSVLGYTLKERIGAGGYGEVWTAVAPGGLPKAVKFVYGYHDDSRAQTELKALNRIKNVRHPFLLSLERIEIVDGQLVVISELADMCLKTRFDECVQSGMNGIPRVELISYLRDAADALDFISEVHRLQHLDVKPENLLLVSGHVKVADYGLVKDIHEGTQSLMAGLTPAYAPPELFDGRPSVHSDQYSLAIVFQEMLTGVRPFDGSTAAQLAAQHMRERPLLQSLPRADQGAISRALSKDPEQRFRSCRELVDELSQGTQNSAARARRSDRRTSAPSSPSRSSDGTIQLSEGTMPFAMRPVAVNRLEPPKPSNAVATFRPTLLVGLGNTGTQVLRRLRALLTVRVGNLDRVPSIKLLCIDTDRRDLAAACQRDSVDPLLDAETLEVPLRRPEQYRSDASMHLNWLSRRWIYNVPRSLQTEGIRPLGRLAFADHEDRIMMRLRQLVSELSQEELLATTAETLEMQPEMAPRVVLIGSVAGGTCSGMGIDVAYAIRTVLQEQGYDDHAVWGLFTHVTVRSGPERQLSIANTLAFLNELYHFSCVEGYPGDDKHLPAFEDERPTLGSTYLVHLGDDLGQHQFETKMDSLSEYLYLNVATPAGQFCDRCRAHNQEETSGLPIRTLGLSTTGVGSGRIVASATRSLQQELIKAWFAPMPSASQFAADEFANNLLRDTGVCIDSFAGATLHCLVGIHGDPVQRLRHRLEGCVPSGHHDQVEVVVRSTIHDFFEVDTSGRGGQGESWDDFSKRTLAGQGQELNESILRLVDLPELRVAAAREALEATRMAFCELLEQIDALQSGAKRSIQELYQQPEKPSGNPRHEPSYWSALAEACVRDFVLGRVRQLTETLASHLDHVHEELERLTRRVDEVMAETNDAQEESPAQDDTLDPELQQFNQQIRAHIEGNVVSLVGRVDRKLQLLLLDQHGGLRKTLNDHETTRAFNRQLEKFAQVTIIEALKEIDLSQFLNQGLSAEQLAEWLTKQAEPRLMSCGGNLHAAIFSPVRGSVGDITDRLREQTLQTHAEVPATVGTISACYEVGQLPVNNVVMHLLQDRPDSIDFASRLHTRTDIGWSPITSMR